MKKVVTVAKSNQRAIAFSLGVCALVLFSSHIEYLRIIYGFLILGGFILLFPSGINLYKQVLNNVLLVFGIGYAFIAIPGHLKNISTVLAFLSLILVFSLCQRRKRTGSIFPIDTNKFTVSWLAASLGVASVVEFPLFTGLFDSGKAFNQLVNIIGADVVGHFNMFGMIDKYQTLGPMWPKSPDGSLFVYVHYPQALPAIQNFFGRVLFPNSFHSVTNLPGLYLTTLGIVLIFTILLIVLSFVSRDKDEKVKFIKSTISSLPAVIILFIGFGSSSLDFGFPNYLFAIALSVTILAIMNNSEQVDSFTFISIAIGVGLIAQSWLLFFPITGIPFIAFTLKFFRRRGFRKSLFTAFTGLLTLLLMVVSAVSLTITATTKAGGMLGALAIPGATPTIQLSLTVIVTIFAISTVSFSYLQRRMSFVESRKDNIFMLIGIITGLTILFALLAYQFWLGKPIIYYLFKFSNGLLLITVSLLPLIYNNVSIQNKSSSNNKVIKSAMQIFIIISIICISFVLTFINPISPKLALIQKPAGINFWKEMLKASSEGTASTADLIFASGEMAKYPCNRPVFLNSIVGEMSTNESNQWASSLSLTWSEASAPVNNLLYQEAPFLDAENVSKISTRIAENFEDACVVIIPKNFNLIQ